jgi:hypothetical protein
MNHKQKSQEKITSMLYSLIVAFLLSFSLPAFAIYKCESGDKVIYGDAPCNNGKSYDLGDKTSHSSASDIAKANEQNIEEKSKLKHLENARHKKEAAEEKQQQKIAKAEVSKKKKCTSLELRRKWNHEDMANSAGKKHESAKRKETRLKEEYELECGK